MGFSFIAFDILPSSCHTGLTTFKMYSWKLRRKGIVFMRQTLHFKFYKNVIKQKYLFSSSDLNFGPLTCHYKTHTHTLHAIQNWHGRKLMHSKAGKYVKKSVLKFVIVKVNRTCTLITYAPYPSHFYNCTAFIFFSGCRTWIFQLSAQKQFHASIQEGSA